ncbi:MAG: hypothetical protein HKN87_24030 [Saprospiraceae bacterium]|nr:hypothetical protein [Saprospiraceae bacterium]
MKSIFSITLAFLASIVPVSSRGASHHIDGIWENSRTKVSVMVQTTASGIKVQRINKNRWYYYQELRDDQFRDDEGNTYYLINEKTLEWEDATGAKRIRFYRKGSSSQAEVRSGDSKRKENTHIQRNHYYGQSGKHASSRVNPDFLEGRWINQHTGQTIRVRGKRRSILVRARRTGWIRFYQDRGTSFMDREGNRYLFDRGKLAYVSRQNDFRMQFRRF